MTLPRILIRGGGDLGSGVAHRLFVSGFPLAILELPEPRVIRRTVAFAQAVYNWTAEVEGVRARLNADPFGEEEIAVLIDPDMQLDLKPDVLIDARMLKRNPDTRIDQAPLVIGLGPGYEAGKDVHFVIETHRGHTLGRVIEQGRALQDTGIPGDLGGESARRVVKAPVAGRFEPLVALGAQVQPGDLLARIDATEVRSQIGGCVRGLLTAGLPVNAREKVADIDPRPDTDLYVISDKARALGGGVLEAVMRRFYGINLIRSMRSPS